MTKTLGRVLLILLAMATAFAQLNTGSITGVVHDPTGAVIPGAKVTLTDTARGFTYPYVTDANGRYIFNQLQPGAYSLRVEANGFTPYERTDITLNVGANVGADATLQIATAGQSVSIESSTPLLNTEDAAVGQTINRTFVNDLPLLGRQVFDLAFLAPGVSQAPGQAYGSNSSGIGNNFVSDGSRNAQSDIVIDGVTTTNYDQNSGWVDPLYTPSVESVQEFRVQQTNFSAEYGFTGGSLVNLVSRTGTNQFHGDAYEFLRNNDLNSNNFFNNKNGVGTPAYRQNDVGGYVGGPVRKNRIFFFGDYEGVFTTQPTSEYLGLPDAAERTGNFGELCSRAGGTFNGAGVCSNPNGQIYDPYANVVQVNGQPYRTIAIPFNNLATYASPLNGSPSGFSTVVNGTTYTGNGVAIPLASLGFTGANAPNVKGNLLSPVALNTLKYLPLPNLTGNPYSNFYQVAPDKTHSNQYDIRVDARLSDMDQLYIKFGSQLTAGLNSGNVLGAGCGSGSYQCGPFDAVTQGNATSLHIAPALGYTHTFSPNTVMTITGGYTHSWSHTQGTGALYPNFNAATDLGMPSYINAAGLNEAPNFTFAGYNGAVGTQTWDVLLYGSDVYQLIGSVVHTQGKHDLHMGGEIRLHRINFTQYGIPNGEFQFNSGGTNQTGGVGGDSLASFMVGFPTGWSGYQIPASPATQNFQYGGFVQDNWHVNDRLTLNLGLRYEIDMPRTERYNRMTYFDPTVASPLQQAPSSVCPICASLMGSFEFVGQNGNPETPYTTYYAEWQPRIGVAYRVGQSTTVRAGYGIYYDPSKGGAAGVGVGGGAFMGYNYQTTMAEYNSNGNITPNANLSNPFPGGFGSNPIPGNVQGNLIALPGGDGGSVPVRAPDWGKIPQEQSWSFGIEHQFPGSVLLDVEYVGRKGTHLYFGGDTYAINHISPAGYQQYIQGNANYMNGNVTWPAAAGCQAVLGGGAYSNPCWAGSFQAYNLYTPYGEAYPNGVWGSSAIQTTDPPWANSIYNGLQVRAEKRFSHGLQALFTYTWQKSIDDSSANGNNEYIDTGVTGAVGNYTTVQDPNNLALERAVSTFNIPQIVQFSWVYQLPFGKGKQFGGSWNRFVDAAFGGWQLQGIYRWDDGLPLQLFLQNGVSVPMGYNQRPNYPTQLEIASNYKNTLQYFSNNPNANGTLPTCSAWVPCPYFDGTAPRNLPNLRQPGTNNMNMSLFKQFGLWSESSKLEIGAEAFNLFNHTQLVLPTGSGESINSGSFGVITQQANVIGGGYTRVVQLRAKLYF